MYKLSKTIFFIVALFLCVAPLLAENTQENTIKDKNSEKQTIGSAHDAVEILEYPEILDLETVQQTVLENSTTLEAAQFRVKQAFERLKQARSLWFPQLQVEYNATRTNLGDDAFFGGGGFGGGGFGGGGFGGGFGLPGGGFDSFEDGEFSSYSLSFRAAFILFDGFSRRFTNMVAQYGHEETQAVREEVERQLINAASSAFFGVQLARENVAIAQADMEFNERLLKDAQARRRVGLGSLSDELNFEVQIRAGKANFIRSRRDMENARVVLAELMGLPGAHLPEHLEIAPLMPEAPLLLEAPVLEEHLDYALEMRPDLHQRRLAVERADADTKRERSSWYPQVNVFASYDGNRYDNSRFRSGDFSSTVGVGVSYDIFTGGRNRAEIAEKKYAHSEAKYQLTESELKVAAEVRQEVFNLRSAQEQLELQRETAEFVGKNRDLVEKEYVAGQAALTRLTQAQRDLVAAQVQLAVARVSLLQAWHNLYTAAGRSVRDLFAQVQAGQAAHTPQN